MTLKESQLKTQKWAKGTEVNFNTWRDVDTKESNKWLRRYLKELNFKHKYSYGNFTKYDLY